MNELNGGRGYPGKRMKDFLAISERLGIWRVWKQNRQGAVFNFFEKKSFFSCLGFLLPLDPAQSLIRIFKSFLRNMSLFLAKNRQTLEELLICFEKVLDSDHFR